MTERLDFHFSLSCVGEGNGNPLQCSCLENPRDGEPDGLPSTGSHRVAQTRLKRLSSILQFVGHLLGISVVGLMVTSSKRAYGTPRSAAPRAPAPVVGHG